MPDPSRLVRRLPGGQRGVDVLVALVATVAIAVAIASAPELDSRDPDGGAYLFAVALGALLLVRRDRPRTVLVATITVWLLYLICDYPAGPLAVPLCVPVYTAAAAGHWRTASGTVVVVVAMSLAWRLVADRETLVETLGSSVLVDALVLGAVTLLGDVVHSRRRWLAEAAERQRLTAELAARETARQIAEERRHVARELHDVLAHTVAVITVQAGVAADAVADGPPEARQAIETIRSTARDARRELQATLNVLRAPDDDAAPREPAPGIDRIGELLDAARRSGLDTRLAVRGTPRATPAVVDLTVFRVVQEALTNVLRHAGAQRTDVEIDYDPAALVVRVTDDGRGRLDRAADDGAEPSGRRGLTGLRERTAALGGLVAAGPRDGGNPGFAVVARIPLDPEGPPT